MRSARSGRKSSLKISFMPSASVCRRPNGPALFGPTRFCMPAMILRSNQTMNIVPTRPMTKMTSTLSTTMSSGVHCRPPSSSGSMAEHQSRSTRTSMAGAVTSTMSAIAAPGDVERHLQRAARHARVGGERAARPCPSAPTMRTSVPSATPRRSRSSGLTWAALGRASGASDGECAVADGPVVQLARQHQPVVVADRGRCARDIGSGNAAASAAGTASTPSARRPQRGAGRRRRRPAPSAAMASVIASTDVERRRRRRRGRAARRARRRSSSPGRAVPATETFWPTVGDPALEVRRRARLLAERGGGQHDVGGGRTTR